MPARVLSINVGRPVAVDYTGKHVGHTSIDKRSVTGSVDVGFTGIEGDQVSDRKYHGGPDKAVYAFAREDLDTWAQRLGREIRDGQFGENLTTAGIDVNESLIGERWQVGSTELEVTDVRIPCNVFRYWMGLSGFDNTRWVRRFAADARPGPYLRVIQPGVITTGDPITVLHKPVHDVTVTKLFRAMTTERRTLPALAEAAGDALAPPAQRFAEKYAAHT